MGRMSDLYIQLQESGLTDEEIQNVDLCDLDFNASDAPTNDEQWWEHQDANLVAAEKELELNAQIVDWRILGLL